MAPDYAGMLIAKLEYMNPGGSVKDRLALAMIEDAEQKSLINKDTLIIEPTSGNTGIGLAMVCAAKGYRLAICMPEGLSLERRNAIKAFGANLILTDANQGMQGAIEQARNLQRQHPGSFIPFQFSNMSNAEMHRKTTAKEILQDTDGNIDIFVAGVGTGGTLTGVGEILKQHNKDIQVIAVEPEGSPVLSGGKPGKHQIQGIGAGFIPAVLNQNIYDEIITVSDKDAFAYARHLARQEGIFAGISSGANARAAVKLAERPENKGKTIVFIACDTGERYLSTPLYESDKL